MAITATVTVVEWRVNAGSTTVHLNVDASGTWQISADGESGVTNLEPAVTQADAIDTASQYAILLETAVVEEGEARTARNTATTYIHDAPSRLANQPQ